VSKRKLEFHSQQKRVNHRKVQQAPHPAIIRLATNVADRAAICSAILAARRRVRAPAVDPARLKADKEQPFSCKGALLVSTKE
jgi:hypothetical protein